MMAIRETLLIGEQVLRETAQKVTDFQNPYVVEVIDDLKDTMYAEDLAGMAAPQIGESLSIFVTEIRETRYRTGEFD